MMSHHIIDLTNDMVQRPRIDPCTPLGMQQAGPLTEVNCGPEVWPHWAVLVWLAITGTVILVAIFGLLWYRQRPQTSA